MTIITKEMGFNKENNTRIAEFFKQFGVNAILRRFGAGRENGYPLSKVWNFIFSLVFSGRNLYRTVESDGYDGMGKDVTYRFLNSVKIHWERILLCIAFAVIVKTCTLTSEKRRNAIVIDDSPYYRDRSKKVELLSRAYDHANDYHYKGFRMLTLGWTDGVDFHPYASHLMSASDPEKRVCEATKFDGRTLAARRRKAAVKTMPERMLDLLKMSRAAKIPAEYVLFDSWFSSPKALIDVHKIGYHVVSMLSRDRTGYFHNGEKKTLNQIFHSLKKRPGKAKYLSSTLVTIKSGKNELVVKLVFVRNKNKKKDWKVLVSTDLGLSEKEIIELYGKRWCIEVFFKTCKSYLKLASEFQGRSYDMLVAHTAVVFIRYIMLAWFSRQDTDHRTINEGFFLLCEEKADISFSEALRYLFAVLQNALSELFWLSPEQVDELLDVFIAKLPPSIRFALVPSCES